jgi:hypothetical protein
MSIPALVRTQDPVLGTIFTTPTGAVTFSSSQGPTILFEVDGTTLPGGVLLNPWNVKYQIQSYLVNNPLGIDRFDLENGHVMEVYPEYSYDTTSWQTYANWSVNPHEGMTAMVKSKITAPVLPEFMRVVARLYPDENGDTTATVLMGLFNYGL